MAAEGQTRAQADWTVVSRLIEDGRLIETEYDGARYYLRRFAAAKRS